MTRPKINKGPERYTVQQLRRKAEEFIYEFVSLERTKQVENLFEKFLEYLEARK